MAVDARSSGCGTGAARTVQERIDGNRPTGLTSVEDEHRRVAAQQPRRGRLVAGRCGVGDRDGHEREQQAAESEAHHRPEYPEGTGGGCKWSAANHRCPY